MPETIHFRAKDDKTIVHDGEHVRHVGKRVDPEVCAYAMGTLENKTFILSTAPVFKFRTEIKNTGYTEKQVGQKNMAARDSLGQTFGTKKRKLDIRAKEENRVEMSSIAPVASAIKQAIQTQAVSIPTRGRG